MRIPIPAVLLFFPAVRLMAQDSTRAAVPDSSAIVSQFRDPTKAAIFGTLFPGAGHVYSTEYLRGLNIYLGTAGSIGMGALVYEMDSCVFAFFNTTCNPGPEWPHRTLGIILIGVGVATWAGGAIDAPRAARRANQEHRRSAQIRPLIDLHDSNRIDLGVGVSW